MNSVRTWHTWCTWHSLCALGALGALDAHLVPCPLCISQCTLGLLSAVGALGAHSVWRCAHRFQPQYIDIHIDIRRLLQASSVLDFRFQAYITTHHPPSNIPASQPASQRARASKAAGQRPSQSADSQPSSSIFLRGTQSVANLSPQAGKPSNP